MAIDPFRTDPILGPGLQKTSVDNYWDLVNPDIAKPSYQPGTKVRGSDGRDYIYVQAHATLSANGRFDVDLGAMKTTANGSGAWDTPIAVAKDAWFHARQYVAT